MNDEKTQAETELRRLAAIAQMLERFCAYHLAMRAGVTEIAEAIRDESKGI